jgi:hypothetical protein
MSFLNSGTPGFYNAPVTKVVIILTVAVNLIGALIGSRRGGSKTLGYGPSSNELLLFKNWWRFITGPLVFTSVGELFFGIICLYVFRLFERQWGSQKYAMFALTSIVSSFLIQLAAVVLLESFRNVWSGPYAIIFACLSQYIFDVPSTTKFKVFGLNVTEKHVVYLLCLQLLLANFPNSLVAGISGLISGFFYRSQALHLRTLFFPEKVIQFCLKYLDPIISSAPPPVVMGMRGANMNNLRSRMPFPQARQTDQPQTLVQEDDQAQFIEQLQNRFIQYQQEPAVSEDSVRTLMDMGFNENIVRRALQMVHNDLNLATELLLSGEVE